MRLFEAIVDANRRALAGDDRAGLRPSDFEGGFPIIVLTCFDPRLHPLMPEVLGVSEPDFIWVTNAGNVVTGPWSSTARSLALACALHDGKEIAVIGHNDCRFFQPARFLLAGRLLSRGFDLGPAAAKLDEFIGTLATERSNVLRSVQNLRSSPLIPDPIPIHGLMVDIDSGQLDWIVNGYETSPSAHRQHPLPPPGSLNPGLNPLGDPLPPLGQSVT